VPGYTVVEVSFLVGRKLLLCQDCGSVVVDEWQTTHEALHSKLEARNGR
jgi:hypothetical protein